jgi:hypothetical protein
MRSTTSTANVVSLCATDLRLCCIRITVMTAVSLYLAGKMNIQAAMAYIQDDWRKTAAKRPATLQLYRAAIGWEPPALSPAAATSTRIAVKGTDYKAVIVAITVTCGVLLVAAALLVWLWRARDTRKTLFGRVAAPGAGADTSIVITDIQVCWGLAVAVGRPGVKQ